MNTTDVFVEQVLVGGLVLAVFVLMSPEWTDSLLDGGLGFGGFAGLGAVGIGCAYLIGIIADRVIDTLLQDLERWNRLRYAVTEGCERYGPDDLFPEDKLRTLVMAHEGPARYADYLRSRIRLTRALAVLSPAISAAVVLGSVESFGQRRYWGIGLAAVYMAAFLLRNWAGSWAKVERPRRKGNLVTIGVRCSVPRTDASREVLEYYSGKKVRCRDVVLHWTLILLVGLQVAAVAFSDPTASYLFVVGGGWLLSVLSLWSWSRISKTFYAHIDVSYWLLGRGLGARAP